VRKTERSGDGTYLRGGYGRIFFEEIEEKWRNEASRKTMNKAINDTLYELINEAKGENEQLDRWEEGMDKWIN